jgi:hypothetical protein
VTVTVGNIGTEAAQAVMIAAKKDAVLAGKATSERVPVLLGDIHPGHTYTATLTFSGVKAGDRMLELRLTFTGGAATLTRSVSVP